MRGCRRGGALALARLAENLGARSPSRHKWTVCTASPWPHPRRGAPRSAAVGTPDQRSAGEGFGDAFVKATCGGRRLSRPQKRRNWLACRDASSVPPPPASRVRPVPCSPCAPVPPWMRAGLLCSCSLVSRNMPVSGGQKGTFSAPGSRIGCTPVQALRTAPHTPAERRMRSISAQDPGSAREPARGRRGRRRA